VNTLAHRTKDHPEAGVSNAYISFEQARIRMIMRDGEPWWVGDDVARSLDLANPRQVISRLEDYEKGVHIMDTLGGRQSVTIINESGFYSLLLTSRKPVAKAMKRWITTEVLPSIRKYGFYDPARLVQLRAKVEAEEPFICETQRGRRFLEEVRRFEQREERPVFDIPGMTKPKLRSIELGADVTKVMGRGDLWLFLLSSGFDLFYILFDERRVAPADEPAIAAIRQEVRLIA